MYLFKIFIIPHIVRIKSYTMIYIIRPVGGRKTIGVWRLYPRGNSMLPKGRHIEGVQQRAMCRPNIGLAWTLRDVK